MHSRTFLPSFGAAVGVFTLTSVLFAADDPASRHAVSVTFSPVHLLFPIVEVTAEARLHDQIGVAGILGYGNVAVADGLGTSYRFSAFEAGAQFRYYVIGSFEHGMQLGAEALWLDIQTSDARLQFSANANGVAVGPFVGYKIATSIGFTFDAQAGVQYVAARASAQSGATVSDTAEATRIIPLLNLNVGWSF